MASECHPVMHQCSIAVHILSCQSLCSLQLVLICTLSVDLGNREHGSFVNCAQLQPITESSQCQSTNPLQCWGWDNRPFCPHIKSKSFQYSVFSVLYCWWLEWVSVIWTAGFQGSMVPGNWKTWELYNDNMCHILPYTGIFCKLYKRHI